MIYTPKEYGQTYFKGRPLSAKTIIRRIKAGLLPSVHTAHKVGRHYLIEVPTIFKTKVR